MKFSILVAASAATLASARPQYGAEPANPHEWLAAGPNDFRGPCPMLNTLTNHGYFPRDGRNITRYNAIKGLKDGLNFNGTLAGIMWDQAVIANPELNATFFTLDQLNVHNVLEHDASLSRTDAYFGNNHLYNSTVFAETRQWWTTDPVTAEQLAHSKIFRQLQSRATNPEYKFTSVTQEFSLGELGAPTVAFGDLATGDVPRPLITYFFENERLPFELGWSQKTEEITLETIVEVTKIFRNAEVLLTGVPANTTHSKRNLHSGLF